MYNRVAGPIQGKFLLTGNINKQVRMINSLIHLKKIYALRLYNSLGRRETKSFSIDCLKKPSQPFPCLSQQKTKNGTTKTHSRNAIVPNLHTTL